MHRITHSIARVVARVPARRLRRSQFFANIPVVVLERRSYGHHELSIVALRAAIAARKPNQNMTLIEIHEDRFINTESISSVQIIPRTQTVTEKPDWGIARSNTVVLPPPALIIGTTDGAKHPVDEEFSARVLKSLFPGQCDGLR